MKVYYRSDDRYECRCTVIEDGIKKRKSFYGPTEKKAMEKLAAFRRNMEKQRIDASMEDITMNQLIKEWFGYKQDILKDSTKANYRGKVEKHILPAFDHTYIHAITHLQVMDFGHKLIEKGLSVSYVRSIIVLLKSILSYAVRAYSIGIQLDLIILPALEYRQREVYSESQRNQLISSLSNEWDPTAIAVLLALCLGLRIGEVCGLTWGDIDFDDNILHIRRTVQRIRSINGKSKTKVICSTPKSLSSVRDIAIPDNLCNLLLSLRLDSTIYIATGTKNFTEPRVLQYRYKAVIKDTGLPYLSFHSLRHSYATYCYEKGFDDVTLSVVLGHSSPEITKRIYIHSSIAHQREKMSLVDIPDMLSA